MMRFFIITILFVSCLLSCQETTNKQTVISNSSESSFDNDIKSFVNMLDINSQDTLYNRRYIYHQNYFDSIIFDNYKINLYLISNTPIEPNITTISLLFISSDNVDTIQAFFKATNFYKFSDEMKVLNQITKQNPVTDTYISIREGDLALDCSYIKNDSSWYKRFATSKENEETKYLYLTSEELDSLITKMNEYKKLLERN